MQYRRAGAWRWRTQRGEVDRTATTLDGLESGTHYQVRVRAVAGDEASRWIRADTQRTRPATRPITVTPEPIVIGWEASGPERQVVPITVTPPPIVIGWTAA